MSSSDNYRHLIPSGHKETVLSWLHNDCPSFDIGGFVVGDQEAICNLLCKQDSVFAGLVFADIIFDFLGISVQWLFEEGARLVPSQTAEKKIIVAVAVGPCNKLLLAERTVLNIMSRGKYDKYQYGVTLHEYPFASQQAG
jgi:nicotinate-nucleotide pyrophosphorylase (carboxylating)